MAFYQQVPDRVNYGQALVNSKIQFQLQSRNILHFFPGEYLVFHALNSMNHEDDPISNCWVITNMRFAKLEKAKSVTDVPLASIQRCSYQKTGMFKWDKVEFTLKNGAKDTAGIADSRHCQWLVNTLSNMVAGQIPPQWNPAPPMMQPVMPVQPVRPIIVQPIQQPVQQPVFRNPNNCIAGVPVLVPGNTVMLKSCASGQNLRCQQDGEINVNGGNGNLAKWVVAAGNALNSFTLQSPVSGQWLRIRPDGGVDAMGVRGGPNTVFLLAPSNQPNCVGLQVAASGLRLGFLENGQQKPPAQVGPGLHGSFAFMQG